MAEIKVAVKGVLIKDQKMLIVQRSHDDETGAGTWESVGGILEFGESFEDALKREFMEEVGLDVSLNKLLFSATFFPHPTRQIVLLSFLCDSLDNAVVLSSEHEQYLWATKDTLLTLLPKVIWDDYEKCGVFDLM